MKSYYLYEIKKGRRAFVEEFEAKNDSDALVRVRKAHPSLKGFECLRTKYVANKLTGAMKGPPRGGA